MTKGSARLFVAASLPEGCVAWIEDNISHLRELWPLARWIPSENRHVTLKFLGSTPEAALAQVAWACESVASSQLPSPLRLGDLGVFPSLRRARVLWIGLEDRTGLLSSLAAALDAELAPLGFEPETRPYSPHLTVARFKAPQAIGDLPELAAPPPPAFELGGFSLWRSHLSPRGARYERLASFALGI